MTHVAQNLTGSENTYTPSSIRYAHFACYVRGQTPQAIQVTAPFFVMERAGATSAEVAPTTPSPAGIYPTSTGASEDSISHEEAAEGLAAAPQNYARTTSSVSETADGAPSSGVGAPPTSSDDTETLPPTPKPAGWWKWKK